LGLSNSYATGTCFSSSFHNLKVGTSNDQADESMPVRS
jgi:hypothetical protein